MLIKDTYRKVGEVHAKKDTRLEDMGGGRGDATKRYLDEEEVGGGEGRMLLKDTWTRRR